MPTADCAPAVVHLPGSRNLYELTEPATLLLVGVDLDDPGNVGALIRTALAAGASGFVAVGCCDAFHPRAVRISRGSLFKLPVLTYPEVRPLLDDLRDQNVRTIGAVADGGTPLPEARIAAGPLALFVGSEAFGLPGEVGAALAHRLTIPMAEGIDSYSVNAAAAILLYSLSRR